MDFTSHKIRNIEKSVCCLEQMIAYNYLFSWTLNRHDKHNVLSYIQNELAAKAAGTYAELYHPIHEWKPIPCDYDLVYHYILQSYDRYIEQNTPIFSDYEALGKVIYSDEYKAA